MMAEGRRDREVNIMLALAEELRVFGLKFALVEGCQLPPLPLGSLQQLEITGAHPGSASPRRPHSAPCILAPEKKIFSLQHPREFFLPFLDKSQMAQSGV